MHATVSAFVRPFAGRVVRQHDAERVVVPLPESGDRAPVPLDPTAYERPAPAVYRYRHRTADGDHAGLVVAMAVAAFADGRVRPHEDVQPHRLEALVDHLATRPERVELVATLHAPGPRFVAALAADAGEPVVDVTTSDSHRHTVWRLPDDPALLAELDAAQHYVADGHHRVAASRVLWEREGRPDGHVLVAVVHAGADLDLEPFHRLLPGPVDADALLTRLAASYDVTAGKGEDLGPWDCRVRVGGRWYVARRRGPRPEGVLPLGVAMLEDALAPTALEPVRAKASRLRDQADAAHGAGFVLEAPALEEILALADAGRTVPAKTTYFRPKPASGLFVLSS